MILKLGQHYQVEIVEILKNGVVAKLEDGKTTFIHVSKLASTYIHDISKVVKLNSVYDAIGVVGKDRDVELSLTHLNLCKPKKDKHVKPTQSLDDMIKSANSTLEDKMKHKKFSKSGINRRRTS